MSIVDKVKKVVRNCPCAKKIRVMREKRQAAKKDK